mgnify:CR=1 FL=1
MGLGFVTGKSVDECANKLRAAIQSNRTTTMGKLSAKLEICVKADGIYAGNKTESHCNAARYYGKDCNHYDDFHQ